MSWKNWSCYIEVALLPAASHTLMGPVCMTKHQYLSLWEWEQVPQTISSNFLSSCFYCCGNVLVLASAEVQARPHTEASNGSQSLHPSCIDRQHTQNHHRHSLVLLRGEEKHYTNGSHMPRYDAAVTDELLSFTFPAASRRNTLTTNLPPSSFLTSSSRKTICRFMRVPDNCVFRSVFI